MWLYKGLFGDKGYTHIEAAGLMGDDENRTKCILDPLKGHCKPRSNKIVAATAYKQLVQGDYGLPKYIENANKSQKHATSAQHMINAYEMQ